MADWLGQARIQRCRIYDSGSPSTSTTAWNPWRRLLTVVRCACPLVPPVPRAWAFFGRSQWSGFLVPWDFGASVRYFFFAFANMVTSAGLHVAEEPKVANKFVLTAQVAEK
jgi:hypothetical protein